MKGVPPKLTVNQNVTATPNSQYIIKMMLEIKHTLSKNFSKTKAKNCLTVIIILYYLEISIKSKKC